MKKIVNLNEKLKVLDETLSKEELIDGVEQLKGNYFEGSLKSGLPDIDTSNMPKHLFADFLASFENLEKDGFSIEDLKEYNNFVRERKSLTGKGYDLGDYIHKESMSDEEIEEEYSDDIGKYWLFMNLAIAPDEFDGDFEKLAKDIDAYMLGFKEKYDEIKNRITPENKETSIKKYKEYKKKQEAIPEIFANGKVVSKEQTGYHSHGTFTSNSTSNGLYAVEYPNKGLTKEDIMDKYLYTIQNAIQEVPKPKAGMYSTIYGARKDYLMDRIKKGEFSVNKKVIRFEDLPYEDVFIGD